MNPVIAEKLESVKEIIENLRAVKGERHADIALAAQNVIGVISIAVVHLRNANAPEESAEDFCRMADLVMDDLVCRMIEFAWPGLNEADIKAKCIEIHMDVKTLLNKAGGFTHET